MIIEKLDRDTPREYVELLPSFYRVEIQGLHEHYTTEEMQEILRARDLDYFRRLAANREPRRSVLLAIGVYSNLEGVLEASRYTDSNLQIGDVLWVLAKSKGHGIGTRLLQEYISRARSEDCDIVGLTVKGTNTKAIELYQRLGFNHAKDLDKDRKVYGLRLK